MAKVLKSGRKQAGWSKEFKCTGEGNGGGGCGATLLVSEYDFYETTSSVADESERHATFCCPQCGVETDVDWNEAPPGLKGKRPSDAERKRIALKNIKGGKQVMTGRNFELKHDLQEDDPKLGSIIKEAAEEARKKVYEKYGLTEHRMGIGHEIRIEQKRILKEKENKLLSSGAMRFI